MKRLVVLSCVLFLFVTATKVFATFPGQNGRIAFTRIGFEKEIRTVNPDGSDEAFVYSAGNWMSDVSPDGSKFLFAIPNSNNLKVVNFDGTAATVISPPFTLFERSPYTFTGFFVPVDNPPIRNVAKAGSAVPVKFSLGGDQGLAIFASGSPTSQLVQCDTNVQLSDVEETVSAGNSSLSYDALFNRYTYVWKTNKAWANTCRRLILKFKEGTVKTAEFSFK